MSKSGFNDNEDKNLRITNMMMMISVMMMTMICVSIETGPPGTDE